MSNSSNLVKLKILRNIKITHNNIDNQFITNKTRYYDNNLENFPDVDPFGLVDLGSVKEVIGSTPQLLDYPNYDWNLLFDFQWQMSENGLNWIDIPNANNININIFNHNLNAYSNVYIRRKANSELVRDVNYSNTLKLIRLDLQKLENNSIFRASDFTKIDGSTPIGGNGLFYQQWMWKCYNDEKYYLLLVNNDDVNNVYGLKNINTILKNNENFSNKNCENRYKLIRKVIVNGDQYIEGRFDIGISMQYINSNELNLNFNTNIVREKMINVISNESVINLFLDNISNETLKVMVWDISNPSLFNEFNVKATSKQIKLNKTFNKGIYAYKVLDSNNIIVKEGKFVIK
ncbi:hypothetical protein [Empedobacter brevis]|uniref:hypothetical protein n=1 Tax=Empedobacter brevis TaxID=247 RepID=UPI00289FA712|nr:hypothetical protein [Empedobacter brevis]